MSTVCADIEWSTGHCGELVVELQRRAHHAALSPRETCARAAGTLTILGMCRNIRPLHNFDPPATQGEVYSAALQYVRKISGSTNPSRANAEAFHRAVDAVAEVSTRLLNELVTTAPPKDREVEAAKARERAAARYSS
jgi:hypothetical protein